MYLNTSSLDLIKYTLSKLKKIPRVKMFDQETKPNYVFKRSKVKGCTIPKIDWYHS